MKTKQQSESPSDAASCSASDTIALVRRYNLWRRGDDSIEMEHPKVIGEALDAICDLASNAVSVESTELFGIRRPLLCVDRPWSEYPLGTKAHSCLGGWWLRTERGWQWNAKHSTFPTPGGEACGACIEIPLPNAKGQPTAGDKLPTRQTNE